MPLSLKREEKNIYKYSIVHSEYIVHVHMYMYIFVHVYTCTCTCTMYMYVPGLAECVGEGVRV